MSSWSSSSLTLLQFLHLLQKTWAIACILSSVFHISCNIQQIYISIWYRCSFRWVFFQMGLTGSILNVEVCSFCNDRNTEKGKNFYLKRLGVIYYEMHLKSVTCEKIMAGLPQCKLVLPYFKDFSNLHYLLIYNMWKRVHINLSDTHCIVHCVLPK